MTLKSGAWPAFVTQCCLQGHQALSQLIYLVTFSSVQLPFVCVPFSSVKIIYTHIIQYLYSIHRDHWLSLRITMSMLGILCRYRQPEL